MNKLVIPSSSAGFIHNLKDLLPLIPDNEWTWAIIEFTGTGTAPDGIGMPDFESCLWELEQGWLFTWEELVSFANGIHQAFSCFIVAVDSVVKIRRPVEVDEPPEGCIIGLEAFDGSEWVIWSDDLALLERFSPLALTRHKV
jgi:hypothetical protein